MHPDKADFKRLVELTGWSQTEAAGWLHKTPSAVNHLMNPDHPNRPTETTMELLRLIIARERPDLIDTQIPGLKAAPTGAKPKATRLSQRERRIIEGMRQLSLRQQQDVYAVVKALMRSTGGKGRKTGQ
jgi:hypothetical protein